MCLPRRRTERSARVKGKPMEATHKKVLFVDNFESNQGWTTENLGALSGDWQRGVPVNDPGWQYDPESDGDGPALVAAQYAGEMPTETFRNYAHHTFRNFIQALQDMSTP